MVGTMPSTPLKGDEREGAGDAAGSALVRSPGVAGTLHPGLAKSELDPSTAWLYKPHTVFFCFVAVGLMVYYSNVLNPKLEAPTEEESYGNAKMGVIAIACVYCLYSTMQGPNAAMVRPHPAMWRLVHGVLMCYAMLLVYLLFQSVHDARTFMRHLDPSLGVPLDERAYGVECRLVIDGKLNLELLYDTLFDEFVIAHTLGWWCKALVFRNLPFLWLLSVSFEIMELTFQHMLPNFNECWWDSWILDVAVCNLLGLWIGMKTVSYFNSRTYNWQGISKQPTLARKAGRAVMQFTPETFDKFDFRPSTSPKRFVQVLALLLFTLIMELNAFFLKFVLWVPPRCMLNTYRLTLWFFLALPGCREFYDYIENQDKSASVLKLGPYAWLCMLTIILEMLVIVKISRGVFTQPWPAHVVWFWGIFSVVLVGGISAWQIKRWLSSSKDKKTKDA